MSGSNAGAGITWRRDSGRFYLTDQHGGLVWSCDPFDPPGTLRQENWVMPSLGTATRDIPWSLAWDADFSCFWISDIVDGNTYGDCYYVCMRQTPVGDTWRWFPENPGDTWLVGSGSTGGAGNMCWMAGSEKCDGYSYFACAPVARSPGADNYVWKFDPYTKTGLGRCSHGSTIDERGCTLVPWDSNYIITTGWNANRHYKRDSSGLALDSAAATAYVPADVALWLPQTVRPDDTVFFYCICNGTSNTLQRISAGMLWSQLPLPGPSNIRPVTILAPAGTVDSGQSVIPRLVVRNTGDIPAAGANSCLTIGAGSVPIYSDSITNIFLGVHAVETLAFSSCVLCGRDTMKVTAWTRWSGDSFPQDDTIRSRLMVQVKDIAVTEIASPAPDTGLDSGLVFHPQCWVSNYGNIKNPVGSPMESGS